jgi:photosystem II protein
MKTSIEFIEGIRECSIPIIQLTKSKNGETGTATFLFLHSFLFNLHVNDFELIKGMYLIWNKKKIFTSDISILFKNGKPFLIKAIFIFKNSQEWFNFLNFMNIYSKETGLFFAETNPFN